MQPQGQPQQYQHTIRFYGSAYPNGRYQLCVFELNYQGLPCRHVSWNFPTLRLLLNFLKKNFPDSKASVEAPMQRTFGFERIAAIAA